MLEKQFTVSKSDTAQMVASGCLPVLGTPTLIAWMESVAYLLLQSSLSDDFTSVGVHIDMSHKKASRIGETIRCVAQIKQTDGRKTLFEITCYDAAGEEVGYALHTRVAVDSRKFMLKVEK
ncbi:MAG: thioesterase family protein [Prevotellaceae bacterium]|jgi:tRNA nucleotidyltransferase (CCA-adding enzyme)|nr:thioesterase family protein [Prevotellaceae bacterium]